MTLQDPVSDPDQDQLLVLVEQCQQSRVRWESAMDLEQQCLAREAHRVCLDRLWSALADDLRVVARGWMRSGMAPDMDSLAMNMFFYIIVALPKLKIDPAKNVRKFFLTIARRGLFDEYRRNYTTGLRRQAKPADPEPEPAPGSHATRMWPADIAQNAHPTEQQPEPADPKSFEAEENLADRLQREAILQVVWNYWPKVLSSDDLRIMQLRWQFEPPLSFRDIARRLGPGWEEDAVRQRHHRVIKDTRRFLREQGLIDEGSPI